MFSPLVDTTAASLSSLRFVYSLLNDPNTSSPANVEASNLYKDNRREYTKRVRETVEKSWDDQKGISGLRYLQAATWTQRDVIALQWSDSMQGLNQIFSSQGLRISLHSVESGVLGRFSRFIYEDNLLAAYDLRSRRYFRLFIVLRAVLRQAVYSYNQDLSVAVHMVFDTLDHEMRGYSQKERRLFLVR